jgi:aspartate 1-decarboxylase
MLITMCKSKIHRATVTDTNLAYEGSLTVDQSLMEAASISEFEQVHVVNVNNGQRFVTYVIKGETSGGIIVNGAASRLAETGDLLIIITYAGIKEDNAKGYRPKIIMVDGQNKIKES